MEGLSNSGFPERKKERKAAQPASTNAIGQESLGHLESGSARYEH